MRLQVPIVVAALLSTTQAYITSPGAVPPGRQMKWLKELTVNICESKIGELSPDQVTQSRDLMYAWSHTKYSNKECAIAVESLLKRVVDEQRSGNEEVASVELTVNDYNCLLEGWARSGQGVAAAERCEQILEAMQEFGPQPDLSSFKASLMAWRQTVNSKSKQDNAPHGPLRAQRILEWMMRLHSEGQNSQALPDADCFDIVLQTWSRSGNHNAPQQTEHILGAMEKLHRSTGLPELKPRKTSFNAVLSAWSKSRDPRAPERAAAILGFMEILSNRGDDSVAPDSASYNIVMNAFAHSQDRVWAAKKADAFVRHVVDIYNENKEKGEKSQLVPDTILFNTAMGLWGKAKLREGARSYEKARSILDCQLEVYQNGCQRCKPDVFGFTSVIGSCAADQGNAKEQAEAFRVALATYRQLQALSEFEKSQNKNSDLEPNHVTYGAMLKACAKLLPARSNIRQKLVREIFLDCRDCGYVGDMVVSKLREACSPDMYKELMQGYNRNNMPPSWNSNVNEQNDFRKHQKLRKNSKKRKRAEV